MFVVEGLICLTVGVTSLLESVKLLYLTAPQA